MYKPALILGSLFAMLSVIIGAFGAHYLKTIFTVETLASFETGVKYQFYHAFALLFMGIYAKTKGRNVKIITMLFAFGILLFSGSIYVLCIMKSTMHIGLGGLGILTPIGGLLMIAAWLMLLISVVRHQAE